MRERTPGPWNASHFSGTDPYSDVWGQSVKLVSGSETMLTYEDANLIAAAQDLLDALKAAFPAMEGKRRTMPGGLPATSYQKVDALIEQARAAIAKAEGR